MRNRNSTVILKRPIPFDIEWSKIGWQGTQWWKVMWVWSVFQVKKKALRHFLINCNAFYKYLWVIWVTRSSRLSLFCISYEFDPYSCPCNYCPWYFTKQSVIGVAIYSNRWFCFLYMRLYLFWLHHRLPGTSFTHYMVLRYTEYSNL